MKIIEDVSVFDINFIPSDELQVRQEMVDSACENIKHSNTYRTCVLGVTGVGKTLIAKKISVRLKDSIIYIYLNCSETSKFIQIGKSIIEQIKKEPYNARGKTRDEISKDLIKILETKRIKKIVLVLDEIDKLVNKKENHSEILFTLLNHGNMSIILISNEMNFAERLDPRVKKRFGENKIILDVYSPNDMYQILKQRAELGLKTNTWDSEILITIAKFSCEVSGDIRHAIQLLEKTAVKAEVAKKDKIDLEDIREAIKEVQVSDIEQVFPTLPKHLKMSIIALVQNALITREGYAVTYPDAYFSYEKLAKNQRFGAVGERQFRDYLRSLEMLNLFSFQWRTAINRRGRLRIAVPNFDFKQFWERINGNNGDGGERGGVGSTSVNSAKDEAERIFSEAGVR